MVRQKIKESEESSSRLDSSVSFQQFSSQTVNILTSGSVANQKARKVIDVVRVI